ncbi:arylsulfatase [Crateriforma spongiae]|uniref:arylsulfatase n=1 Tax=Crateriforma spongiae TaxID=2724528 RepID=UPI001447030B|nr:arylsulfatase [Crateriforma spongiae]
MLSPHRVIGRRFSVVTAIVLFAACVPPITTAADNVETSSRSNPSPNVLLIVTDDQGYGDMGCHGNPWLKTPNLDTLATQSVRLTDYHVDPICTPTRSALMTGRYCTRVGAWDVVIGRQMLRHDETTMAQVFRDSGYRTAMFGKWHLGDTYPYAPRFRGFDDVFCHRAGGVDEIGNPPENDYFDDTYFRNGVSESTTGYCTDVWFDNLLGYLDDHQASGTGATPRRPFFVYLPLNAMHSPFRAPEEAWRPYAEMGIETERAKFYGMIANFDANLGRLMAAFEKHDMADDTIVIFMSDNGTAMGSTGTEDDDGYNAGMRGKKGSVYDGGHRVACFVRWPDGLPSDVDVNHLTCHRDWMPTLIDLCDLSPPKDVSFDGRSMAAILKDPDAAWPDRKLFVQRQSDQPVCMLQPGTKRRKPNYAVMTEQFRLVNGQLFDIESDPGQRIDVADRYPDIVEELSASYREHFEDVYGIDPTEGEGRRPTEPTDDGGVPFTRFMVGPGPYASTLMTVRDWHPTKGGVIWQQPQLADNDLWIQGFWALNVKKAGRYRVKLSRYPDQLNRSMQYDRVELTIGPRTWSQSLDRDDSAAEFSVTLPAGDSLVKTRCIDSQAGRERGAYYVRFEHLAD